MATWPFSGVLRELEKRKDLRMFLLFKEYARNMKKHTDFNSEVVPFVRGCNLIKTEIKFPTFQTLLFKLQASRLKMKGKSENATSGFSWLRIYR